LRTISEAVTESRDLHITNDWSHIISKVISIYRVQDDFQLVSEDFFVYRQEVTSSAKARKESDYVVAAHYKMHDLVTSVLFSTQPAKGAVVEHGVAAKGHVVTEEGWNTICKTSANWFCYNIVHLTQQ